MKYVIVIAILARSAYSQVSDFPQLPDISQLPYLVMCIAGRSLKCYTTCDPNYMFKTSEDGMVDITSVNCCELSRCAHCLTKNVEACGSDGRAFIK